MNSFKSVRLWFNNHGVSQTPTATTSNSRDIDWVRVIPFIFIHVACLAVIWVGWSPVAVATAVVLYLVRMFAITAFYHRYFSHKTFKTSRPVQFLFAVMGASATQRGPLWWAAHHRQHHRASDTEDDPHSPRKGFWWSHVLWFLSDKHFRADYRRVQDWQKFPELVWLDRHDLLIPFILSMVLFALGSALATWWPELGTNGLQMMVWGYFISTVCLTHATLSINSLAHRWGSRRFDTEDDSRNNGLLALITLGEGWHNNHHYYQGSARQGFFWWEIDISYYIIRLMGMLGIVWDIKEVPAHKLAAAKRTRP